MCTINNLPSLTIAQIEALKVKPYPPRKRNADDDIFQNNDHVRKEGDRISVLASELGVPTNEHGLVTEAVLDDLTKISKEE